MFTGIVDHCGKLVKREGSLFEIETEFRDLVLGESVAVNGACLTVTAIFPGRFQCDVSPETLARTGLGTAERVNLERALRLSDRIGGHLVTGHVDQTGTIRRREQRGEWLVLGVGGVLPEHRKYLMKKGSVAIQGVSLTVNDVTEDGFECLLVPHTQGRTNLGEFPTGSVVNLEFDWMMKVVLNETH